MGRPLDLSEGVALGALENSSSHAGGMLVHTVVALVVGGLLGALTGMRYEEVFGLSEPVCVGLRSLVVVGAWTWVGLARPGEIVAALDGPIGELCEDPTVLEATDPLLSSGRQRVHAVWEQDAPTA